MIRLDKYLSNLGKGSRSDLKSKAKNGNILVNGQKVFKTETKINEEIDEVIYCGETIRYKKHIYLMLNKKAGYVTANIDNFDPTVFELLDEEYKKMELHAVGRLDKDTEGLLLITNNGELSHNLMSPKKHVDKTYYAKVSSPLKDEDINVFKNGIVFKDGTKLKPACLEILSETECYVTISEGKFHQVKNMFRVIDNHVLYLKRVSVGGLLLDENLEIGKYRELTQDEENYLLEITGLI